MKNWWQKLSKKFGLSKQAATEPVAKVIEPTEQLPALELSGQTIQMVFDLNREPLTNLGLPPNAIPGLSVIKALTRGLRYTAIEPLIGQKFQLSSLADTAEELRTLIKPYGIELGTTLSESGEDAFRKYGLLEHDFDILKTEMAPESQRVRFLKELGLLPDKAEVNDLLFADGGIGFLEELLDETRQNKLLFKIFLDCHKNKEDLVAQIEPFAEHSSQLLPCEFTVRDACITNCSLVWINKHFYL